jgi:Crp-like helix-turn-helix domain
VTQSDEALHRHRSINAITRRISGDDWSKWALHSSLVRFEAKKSDVEHPLCRNRVIFPTTSVFSLSSESRAGGLAESTLIGNEGLVGLDDLTRTPKLAMKRTLQTGGFGIVVSAEFIQRELDVSSSFRRCILDYSSAIVRYASQTCFCYRHHSLEQQVVKMILLTLRRTGSDKIDITHERIGLILGIRREAVSTAIGHLSDRKLVEQSRSRITVPDVIRLEGEACECYNAICKFLGYS